jgi:hypothetical protein
LQSKEQAMTDPQDLTMLESQAYRRSYSDGIIDIYVGLSLLWIGGAWLWLPDLAGLAGILPAVFIVPMLEARKRIVEARGGYVKWAQPRRRWERRNLAVVLAAGVALLLLGVTTYVAVTQSPADSNLVSAVMPGLLAWLLALLMIGLGFLMQTWRMFIYAAVLAVGGALTAWQDASPGWPMLMAGITIAATGTAMLVTFIRDNPVMEAG